MAGGSPKVPDGFADKALAAVPGWAWGFLGLFIGIIMALQLTGYNGALQRIIEAQVKRIERSVDSMDEAAKRMEAMSKQLQQYDRTLVNHEMRITELEKRK